MTPPRITVTFDGHGVSLDDDDTLPLGRLDVWYRYPYVMVTHGALDGGAPIPQAVTGVVGFDGREAPLRLEFGQAEAACLLTPAKRSLNFSRTDFWPKYLALGPDMNVAPLDKILAMEPSFGPWPDPAKTNATGSGRLFANRVVPVMQALILAHHYGPGGIPRPWVEAFIRKGDEWVNRQLKRGQHFYYRHDAYREWLPSDPGIPYQGYGSSRGGFRDLFGVARPAGVEFPSSGDAVCDPQHLAHDQTILLALLLDSLPAEFTSRAGVTAAESIITRENFAHPRPFGHFLRCVSLAHAAFPDVGFEMSLEAAVQALKARHVTRGGLRFPLLDHGGSTDGGHLTQDDLQDVYELFGVTDAEARREMAQSFSTWMGAILLTGLETLYRFGPRELREDAAEIGGMTWNCLKAATQRAFDVHQGKMRAPEVLWDDFTVVDESGVMLAEDGGKNFIKGVGIRFIAPALGALAAHGDQFAGSRQMLRAIVNAADGWYSGPDPLPWNLECWTHGHALGWVGT